MLALEDATIGFGSATLFERASFVLEPGEVKGLVAPNGYGKTTLMRALAGDLCGLRRGAVVLEGRTLCSDFTSEHVFYTPGDASMLHSHLSVAEHLYIVRDLWDSGRSVEKVADACGISGFLNKPVRKLSQGMKQQVSLAVACLSGASYLLLDEPMNALDPLNVQRFSAIIRRLAKRGAGVLVSSHILESIDQLCGSVIFVHERGLEEVPLTAQSAELFRGYYGSYGDEPLSFLGRARHMRG